MKVSVTEAAVVEPTTGEEPPPFEEPPADEVKPEVKPEIKPEVKPIEPVGSEPVGSIETKTPTAPTSARSGKRTPRQRATTAAEEEAGNHRDS